MFNIFVGILANTFNTFDARSTGLYLAKIISSREEMDYDPSYGAILSAIPPTNVIQAFLFPVALVLGYNNKTLMALNEAAMKV